MGTTLTRFGRSAARAHGVEDRTAVEAGGVGAHAPGPRPHSPGFPGGVRGHPGGPRGRRPAPVGQLTTPLDNSGVDKDGNPLPTGAFTPRTDRTVIAPDALNKTPIDPSRSFPGVQIQARIASDPTGEARFLLRL